MAVGCSTESLKKRWQMTDAAIYPNTDSGPAGTKFSIQVRASALRSGESVLPARIRPRILLHFLSAAPLYSAKVAHRIVAIDRVPIGRVPSIGAHPVHPAHTFSSRFVCPAARRVWRPLSLAGDPAHRLSRCSCVAVRPTLCAPSAVRKNWFRQCVCSFFALSAVSNAAAHGYDRFHNCTHTRPKRAQVAGNPLLRTARDAFGSI